MPIDFSKYAQQPEPLKRWDFGQAFYDYADAERAKKQLAINQGQLDETRANRQDANARWAGNVDVSRGDADHTANLDRWKQTVTNAGLAREAAAKNEWNTVEALRGSIVQGGGTVEVVETPEGPRYRIVEPAMPTRQYNMGETNSQVFGGAPPPARNPFERLPGAAAARMPAPPPAPAQPPPSSSPAPPAPPAQAAPAPAQPPTAGAAPQPLPPGTAQPGMPNTTPPEDIQKLQAGVEGYVATQPKTPAEADLDTLNSFDGEEPPEDDEAGPINGVPQPMPAPEEPMDVDPSKLPGNVADPGPEGRERPDAEVLAEPEPEDYGDPETDRAIRLYEAQRAAAGQLSPQLPEPAPDQPEQAPPEPPEDVPSYTPPAYAAPEPSDPLTIDPSRLSQMNQVRLDPALKGLEDAMPLRFRRQMASFRQGVSKLGLPPAETLKLMEGYFRELASTYRGQMQSDAMSGRADAARSDRQLAREDMAAERAEQRRIMNADRAFKQAKSVLGDRDFKDINIRLAKAREADSLIDMSTSGNGNAANSLIALVYGMYEKGLITDKDFDRTNQGKLDIWDTIEKKALETFVHSGMTVDTGESIKELIKQAVANREGEYRSMANRVWAMRNATKDEGLREGYEQSIRGNFEERYWPQEMLRLEGLEGFNENAPPPAPAQVPSLGDAGKPLPYGRVDGSYAGPHARGSRVPPKPPRKEKPVKDMTLEEVKAEARRMLGK